MTTYATVNPATGETLEEFRTLDEQGVESALARSHAAFSTWRATSPAERVRGAGQRGDGVRRAP